jgi:hypothetical protein
MQAARSRLSLMSSNLLIKNIFMQNPKLVRLMQQPDGRGAHFDAPESYP